MVVEGGPDARVGICDAEVAPMRGPDARVGVWDAEVAAVGGRDVSVGVRDTGRSADNWFMGTDVEVERWGWRFPAEAILELTAEEASFFGRKQQYMLSKM